MSWDRQRVGSASHRRENEAQGPTRKMQATPLGSVKCDYCSLFVSELSWCRETGRLIIDVRLTDIEQLGGILFVESGREVSASAVRAEIDGVSLAMLFRHPLRVSGVAFVTELDLVLAAAFKTRKPNNGTAANLWGGCSRIWIHSFFAAPSVGRV
jgi:hypothetical protein